VQYKDVYSLNKKKLMTVTNLRLRQLLCLRQHVMTNARNIVLTRPRCAFWGIFHRIVTLDLLIPIFDSWSNSVNKYQKYLANNVSLGWTDARADARSLWKHNASCHYIGGGI